MEVFVQNIIDVFAGDLKYYWMLAVFGTIVFLIQTAFSLLFGLDGHSDIDASGGGDIDAVGHADAGFGDFKLISFRSVMAFIMFFGWGGVLFGHDGVGGFFGAFACGLIMMVLTAAVIFYIFKLQQSGNINPEDIVGKVGTVYLKIPAGRTETGKVTVIVGSFTREIIAVADDEILTGASVNVVKKIDNKRFLVTKK
jgi:hypothetical protein